MSVTAPACPRGIRRWILVPATAAALVGGLAAPALSADPVSQAQTAVVASDAPLPAISGPVDLAAVSIVASGGNVEASRVLPNNTCTPSNSPAKDGLTPDASHVLDCVSTAFPGIEQYLGVGHRAANGASDHPSGRAVDVMIADWDQAGGNAQGWQVANFVAANAQDWNVRYVIWDAKIYSPKSGTWRAYHHPSGATDPNNMHLNHVHVSVNR